MNPTAQPVQLAGDTPATVQLALGLAQLNIPVTLWLGASDTGHASWPLTALAGGSSGAAFTALCDSAAQILPEQALQTAPAEHGHTYLWQDAQACEVPQPQLFGVTAAVLAPAAMRLLGRKGSWRAYFDRLLPVLTIGNTRSFATLVAKRQGQAAARLAATVHSAHHPVPFAQFPTSAATGLNAALTRAGSLGGAVTQLHAQREQLILPVQGVFAARAALLRVLEYYGVRVLHSEPPAQAQTVTQLCAAVLQHSKEAAPDTAVHNFPAPGIAEAAGTASAAAAGASAVAQVPAQLHLLPGDELLVPLDAAGLPQQLAQLSQPPQPGQVVRLRCLYQAEFAALQQSGYYGQLPETVAPGAQYALLSCFAGVDHAPAELTAAAKLAVAATLWQLQLLGEVWEQVPLDAALHNVALQELELVQQVLPRLGRELLGFSA